MIEFKSIGTIHTPFMDRQGMPIQPAGAQGISGTVELLPEYAAGVQDLRGFSHIILLYVFHHSNSCSLLVTPFMDSVPRGVFATRAPNRPNPIGLSVVRLVGVDGTKLHIEGIDVLNGTPLLDIKPYAPEFDHPSGIVRTGWLEKSKQQVSEKRSDDRFK
ncbi:MAG: tRNA (N6-threonylcarbamoyladenosine(37)-N6)-methyltransferase TrmO [Desulfobacterales bacterium]|nr:tRNA (N6-threonylcarbamoyladenosine(37)-N6)-methyltransferase TrmO [Desulfobacterales bacterium]